MDRDLVSVIMPAYNAFQTISESIESVLNQTHRNFELILVNDGSNDRTLDIINCYKKKDRRVKLINNKENKGIAFSRNVGITNANGKYVAFLDSDDVWTIDKLEKQLNFMGQNSYVMSMTSYYKLDENCNKKKIEGKKSYYTYEDLLKYNPIGCLTVMIETKVIKRNLMPSLPHEDYATWIKVLKKERVEAGNLKECLALYRIRAESISANKFKTLKWTYDIYNKCVGKSKFISSLFLMRFIFNTIRKNL